MGGAPHVLPLLWSLSRRPLSGSALGLHYEFELQSGTNGQQLVQTHGGRIQIHGRYAALAQIQPVGQLGLR